MDFLLTFVRPKLQALIVERERLAVRGGGATAAHVQSLLFELLALLDSAVGTLAAQHTTAARFALQAAIDVRALLARCRRLGVHAPTLAALLSSTHALLHARAQV